MNSSEPDEMAQRHVNAMGADLGIVFKELSQDLLRLHWKWNEYVTLYGAKPERIDLLNEAAGAFFRLVQDCLWEDILLHIARLTGPVKSAGKNNLSVRCLYDLVVPDLKERTERLLAKCVDKSEFAKDWRNRRIAHSDLSLVLNENSKPLARASRKMVRECLEAISELLNEVQNFYEDSIMLYNFARPLPGAEELLYVLRDGLEAESARQKRFESGEVAPEDWEQRDI